MARPEGVAELRAKVRREGLSGASSALHGHAAELALAFEDTAPEEGAHRAGAMLTLRRAEAFSPAMGLGIVATLAAATSVLSPELSRHLLALAGILLALGLVGVWLGLRRGTELGMLHRLLLSEGARLRHEGSA